MPIVHEINSSFEYDTTINVSGVFLGISKAFDKVWYEGVLFKLKTYGVNGKMLTLLTNYLHECYQRAVLHEQISSLELVKSGVPQGSILGLLSFLICINDLLDNIEFNCKVFADDTSLFYNVFDKHVSRATLNKGLELKALSILFFPFYVGEWNKLDNTIRDVESIKQFKSMFM